jgi:hypothetical protein
MTDVMLADASIMVDTTNDSQAAVKLILSDATKASAKVYVSSLDIPITSKYFLYDDSAVVINNPGDATLEDIGGTNGLTEEDAVRVTAKEATGSFNLKAELVLLSATNAAEATSLVAGPVVKSTLSTATKTFNVADGVPGDLVFEIAALPTLKGLVDFATAVGPPATTADAVDNDVQTGDNDDGAVSGAEVLASQTDAYAQQVSISAKDANGNSFALPYDRIVSLASSNTALLNVVADTAAKKWYAYGMEAGFGSDSSTILEKTATLTAQIGTDTGVKSTNLTVTVSRDSIKVTEVKFIDTMPASTLSQDLPSDWVAKDDLAMADVKAGTPVFYIVTKDQFGVYKHITGGGSDVDLRLINTDRARFTSVKYDSDAAPTYKILVTGADLAGFSYNLANGNQYKKESTLNLLYTAASGVTGTLTVRTGSDGLVSESSSIDRTAPTITVATRTGANALTLTFSEAVYSTNAAAGALAAADVRHSALGTFADGEDLATITHTAGATSATATTTTATVAATSTVGSAATSIYDATGNVMTTVANGTAETLVTAP